MQNVLLGFLIVFAATRCNGGEYEGNGPHRPTPDFKKNSTEISHKCPPDYEFCNNTFPCQLMTKLCELLDGPETTHHRIRRKRGGRGIGAQLGLFMTGNYKAQNQRGPSYLFYGADDAAAASGAANSGDTQNKWNGGISGGTSNNLQAGRSLVALPLKPYSSSINPQVNIKKLAPKKVSDGKALLDHVAKKKILSSATVTSLMSKYSTGKHGPIFRSNIPSALMTTPSMRLGPYNSLLLKHSGAHYEAGKILFPSPYTGSLMMAYAIYRYRQFYPDGCLLGAFYFCQWKRRDGMYYMFTVFVTRRNESENENHANRDSAISENLPKFSENVTLTAQQMTAILGNLTDDLKSSRRDKEGEGPDRDTMIYEHLLLTVGEFLTTSCNGGGIVTSGIVTIHYRDIDLDDISAPLMFTTEDVNYVELPENLVKYYSKWRCSDKAGNVQNCSRVCIAMVSYREDPLTRLFGVKNWAEMAEGDFSDIIAVDLVNPSNGEPFSLVESDALLDIGFAIRNDTNVSDLACAAWHPQALVWDKFLCNYTGNTTTQNIKVAICSCIPVGFYRLIDTRVKFDAEVPIDTNEDPPPQGYQRIALVLDGDFSTAMIGDSSKELFEADIEQQLADILKVDSLHLKNLHLESDRMKVTFELPITSRKLSATRALLRLRELVDNTLILNDLNNNKLKVLRVYLPVLPRESSRNDTIFIVFGCNAGVIALVIFTMIGEMLYKKKNSRPKRLSTPSVRLAV